MVLGRREAEQKDKQQLFMLLNLQTDRDIDI